MLLFGTTYTSFNSDWRRQHINFFSHKSYALSFYKVTWGVKRAGCLRGGQRQPEVQIIIWLSVREVLIGVKFKWNFLQWPLVRQIWRKLNDTNSNFSEKKLLNHVKSSHRTEIKFSYILSRTTWPSVLNREQFSNECWELIGWLND